MKNIYKTSLLLTLSLIGTAQGGIQETLKTISTSREVALTSGYVSILGGGYILTQAHHAFNIARQDQYLNQEQVLNFWGNWINNGLEKFNNKHQAMASSASAADTKTSAEIRQSKYQEKRNEYLWKSILGLGLITLGVYQFSTLWKS